MSLPRWNSFDENDSLRDEMDPLFEESLVRALDTWPEQAELEPVVPIDLFEMEDKLVIFADLPGLNHEAVSVDVSGYTLKIQGEFQDDFSIPGGCSSVYFKERGCGKFQRAIPLPSNVDAQGLDVNYKDGVLRVMLPKVEGAPVR